MITHARTPKQSHKVLWASSPQPSLMRTTLLPKALPNPTSLSPSSAAQITKTHFLQKENFIQFLVHPKELLVCLPQHHVPVLSTARMITMVRNSFVCKGEWRFFSKPAQKSAPAGPDPQQENKAYNLTRSQRFPPTKKAPNSGNTITWTLGLSILTVSNLEYRKGLSSIFVLQLKRPHFPRINMQTSFFLVLCLLN